MTTSPYMTRQEAGDYLRINARGVDKLILAKKLTRFKRGQRVLVAREEVALLVTIDGEPGTHQPERLKKGAT